MNKKSRYFLAIVLVSGLLVHFLFIFNYSYPTSKNQKINYITQYYIYPLFHQNWSLFAPVPTNSQKLYIRYKKNENWSDWQDVMQQPIIKHQCRKVAGDELLVLLLSHSLRNFNIQDFNNISLPENSIFYYSINQYLKLNYHLINETSYEILITSNANSTIHPVYIKNQIIY